MAAQVCAMLLLCALSCGSGPDLERGRTALQRVRNLAAQSEYGGCWARALEHLDTRCRDMTSDIQSRMALSFAFCHLSSSGRDFPSCPAGSEVSRCTAGMDAVAFNTYTEFFTHAHSICHFLQSDTWQSRAEDTMHRLTESSADVAEQLQSTRQMAEELIDAQTAALQVQKDILNNGDELRVTLRDSTQGLRVVFSELSTASRQQQVALSELFNRVSFLQSFLLMEAQSLSSCCYNAGALCTSFLVTSTQRSSRASPVAPPRLLHLQPGRPSSSPPSAKLLLLTLVFVNFYLERRIYLSVISSDHAEHKHMELVGVYVSVLRRLMVCVAVCVLLYVCVTFRDPLQQSLQLLQQLRETQKSLQEALQHAEALGEQQKKNQLTVKRRPERRREEVEREEMCSSLLSLTEDQPDRSHLPHVGWSTERRLRSTVTNTHNASAQSPSNQKASVRSCRRSRGSASSPLVYSILVEENEPRYSLRSRSEAR
uniref:Protein brambleberry n=1 Tax=Gasterosteus aculeatus aculeatus TaxID=481459 RepID=A0AAQ4NP48_GASAC